MNQTLLHDQKQISVLLEKAKEISLRYFQQQEQFPPGRWVENRALENLPRAGLGGTQTLEHFEKELAPYISNTAGPRYFGFVTGGSTPASIAGDWLVSAYDQNAFGSNDSIAPQVERQTLHFLKQLFGLDESYFGSFVTGATISNMVGLALGRQWLGEQAGVDFSQSGIQSNIPINVLSAAPHSSVIKSLSMLGMGRNAVIKIPTLPAREAIDLKLLEDRLWEIGRPVIIVANAGTVNSVDFDDLEAIGKLKSRYPFWLHVDAAFGGFAAVSPKFAHLIKGINSADSITIDAHKWLNVPYDSAMQFTRHKNLQLKVFQNSAAYLGDPSESPDYFHYTPENSRRWRALPAWFSLMAYGADGYRDIVERNCAAAKKLGDWIQQADAFKLLAPVYMNVACFTFKDETTSIHIKEFLSRVRDDGRVFFTPTVYHGVPAIRAAFSNWQTQEKDVDLAIDVLTTLSSL